MICAWSVNRGEGTDPTSESSHSSVPWNVPWFTICACSSCSVTLDRRMPLFAFVERAFVRFALRQAAARVCVSFLHSHHNI